MFLPQDIRKKFLFFGVYFWISKITLGKITYLIEDHNQEFCNSTSWHLLLQRRHLEFKSPYKLPVLNLQPMFSTCIHTSTFITNVYNCTTFTISYDHNYVYLLFLTNKKTHILRVPLLSTLFSTYIQTSSFITNIYNCTRFIVSYDHNYVHL